MDKRYQVFISSTYVDLHQERQELIRALLELDCIPAGMELFPASDDDAWTLIKRIIDESDYYLVISAGRYGSVHPETGIGYTEMEYDYAVETGKPIIGFIHGNLPSLQVKKSDTELSQTEKLEAFRGKIRSRVVKEWNTPEVLAGVASRAIIQLIKQKPGVGWVRADSLPSPEKSAQVSEMKVKILQQEKEIDRLKQLQEKLTASTDNVQVTLGAVPEFGIALDYMTNALPELDGEGVIFRIMHFLAESGNRFISFSEAASRIAGGIGLSRSSVTDVLHALQKGGAIILDADDDIVIDSRLRELSREWSMRSRMASEP